METYHLTSAQDNVTGEYQQVGYIGMKDAASRMTQFGLLAFISSVAGYVFFFLARNLGKLPENFQIGIQEIVIGTIVFLATLVTQAWMHVLILRTYGAKPEFGIFRNGIVYLSIPEYGLRRNSVIAAALMPLVVLTGLSLLGIWLVQGTTWVALFALIAIVNTAASTSHLWVIAILLRYPSIAWTVDDKDGMRILLPMENK